MRNMVLLGALVVLTGCGDLNSSEGSYAGRLVLDCGGAGVIEGVGDFNTLRLPDGKTVRGGNGEVRTFPDGIKMSAIPYSDGSVLYTKASKPSAFFYYPAGGSLTKCEIP